MSAIRFRTSNFLVFKPSIKIGPLTPGDSFEAPVPAAARFFFVTNIFLKHPLYSTTRGLYCE